MGDVSLDSCESPVLLKDNISLFAHHCHGPIGSCLEGMIRVVQRTGHSSFYVEKGMNARKQLGSSETSKIDPLYVTGGGKFALHFFADKFMKSLC